MVADRYDVDPKYFEDKYGMPCKVKKNPLMPDDGNHDDDDIKDNDNDSDNDSDKIKQNNARPFFD